MGKLKLKNSSLEIAWVYGVIKKGVILVKEIENWEKQKLHPELIRSIANFIEEEIESLPKKIRIKVNKDELVFEINKQAFELTDDELNLLKTTYNDSIDNKLIKKNGALKKCLRYAKSLLQRKSPAV